MSNAKLEYAPSGRTFAGKLDALSREEKRRLKLQLLAELEKTKDIALRIEARSEHLRVHGGAHPVAEDHARRISNGCAKELSSSGGLLAVSTPAGKGFSLQLADVGPGKEKRTPKANSAYINPDFVSGRDKMPPPEKVGKKAVGQKRMAPLRSLEHREPKRQKIEAARARRASDIMKQCASLLKRLMTHKYSWVFNTPVDAKALGLADYFTVIKKPMDLGTVNSRLKANGYSSPDEFIEDVSLVWNNAMAYNPPGTDVHIMAAELKRICEDGFLRVQEKVKEDAQKVKEEEKELEEEDSYFKEKREVVELEARLQRLESQLEASKGKGKGGRSGPPPKPKPSDTQKREMTFEEKRKLSVNLGRLPGEKLSRVVQIISERNPHLSQNDEEIELDIDSLDNETLWELDRYVLSCMKPKSKGKKKNGGDEDNQLDIGRLSGVEGPVVGAASNSKNRGEGEGSVDIDDEISTPIRPAEQTVAAGGSQPKPGRGDGQSSSSGSSDTGSSSSDSESGSASSGSDSEGDEAQSTVGESRAAASIKAPSARPLGPMAERRESGIGRKGRGEEGDAALHVTGEKTAQIGETTKSSFDPQPQPEVPATAGRGRGSAGVASEDATQRAALLKGKYADMILNAKRKTIALHQDITDPKKLQELERKQKEEKFRMEAAARAAREAHRKREMEAREQERKRVDEEREAERKRLMEMERTVDIDENHQVLRDLQMLHKTPGAAASATVQGGRPQQQQLLQDTREMGAKLAMYQGLPAEVENPLEELGFMLRDDEDEEEDESDDEAFGKVDTMGRNRQEIEGAPTIEEGEVEEGEI